MIMKRDHNTSSRHHRRALLALASVAALAGGMAAAEAGRIGISRDYGYNGLRDGYVVAHSRFGNGSITGAVRQTSVGPQVRLPGGTWEYCRRSCSETLRVETVDYWEGRSDGASGLSQECGLLGCLSVRIGR
ncbi:MAG: hypothetical protein JNM89_13380 [Hyphomicrobiaceae bacterium]|nr:hypothetical protein [Hyphomicrobiaceae bacterium]